MFYWDESWTGVRYSSSPPNMYFRLLKVFLYERSVFMLKIDNERLTDKTTILWENESGIMSTFTLRIETYSEDLGDIKLEFRTTLTKDELDDIKDERNKSIVKKLYEELEKGNSNTSHILDWFEDEQTINEISWILAYDFEITEVNKCIEDILKLYSKEKVISQRNEIIKQLERIDLSQEEKNELETRLNNIIIQLAKMK